MISLNQLILRTDVSGMPLEWIHFQTAVKLYYSEQVAYTCGTPILAIHGGFNAKTGARSAILLNSIIATYGSKQQLHAAYVPPLNNSLLFRRDNHICLYCGEHFMERNLSRDHVHPLVQGGRDVWTNVVTACKHCNSRKGGRTPEQAHMPLLAVPFQPTYAEYIFLQGRNILADQMEFLSAHFPRTSKLRDRCS
ncbi:MAG TPA: HNH endonuclease [Candidatus Thiothrix moscowensis]|uniref:HNH endonuclease n=1 Tax=unclassified Thiothrix TaxID=2636184 RepID=UPI0025ED0213|nr:MULTISPECIES: HNH endonuclease [unclassified Thiothrix]HRJ51159.1 HNH endonuclease [Candidatus Thiothrix moscowensis]HRJ91786.1 HNH endonuclease [Candidatus Thiothrix moscowensis]